MLAVVQRGFDQLARHAFLAADQFDHHIGVACGQRQRIGDPVADVETAFLFGVAGADGHDLKLAPGLRRQRAPAAPSAP